MYIDSKELLTEEIGYKVIKRKFKSIKSSGRYVFFFYPNKYSRVNSWPIALQIAGAPKFLPYAGNVFPT